MMASIVANAMNRSSIDRLLRMLSHGDKMKPSCVGSATTISSKNEFAVFPKFEDKSEG